MSGRGDIRMHVEHLFEGRTLDAETIELKEEIYGNLVARFDDYVAQGMGEDEALRLTLEAVTSVEGVMGGAAAERGDGPADSTRAMPAPEQRPGAAAGAPVPPGADGSPATRRWSTGKVVAAVAGVLLAGMVLVTLFNVLSMSEARESYDDASQTVQQVDQPTADETGGGSTTSQQTTGGGSGGASSTLGGANDLSDQITDVSPGALADYGALSVASPELGDLGSLESTRLQELVRSLPLGSYFAGTGTREGSDFLQLTYNYQSGDERDRIAIDDDYVDRALVFNAAALMCTIPDLNTLSVQEIELDDNDTDEHVFERAAMEEALGVALDADQLTDESWPALREQLMTKRVWDRIWERADRD